MVLAHVWTLLCHSASPFCHIFFYSVFIFTLFCSFSCWLSCLWRAKQLLAFLLSFVYKAFSLGLPLLFSWEVAEAVFREDFEVENICAYFKWDFFFKFLWSNWLNKASLIYKQHRQLSMLFRMYLSISDPCKTAVLHTHTPSAAAQSFQHLSSWLILCLNLLCSLHEGSHILWCVSEYIDTMALNQHCEDIYRLKWHLVVLTCIQLALKLD